MNWNSPFLFVGMLGGIFSIFIQKSTFHKKDARLLWVKSTYETSFIYCLIMSRYLKNMAIGKVIDSVEGYVVIICCSLYTQ